MYGPLGDPGPYGTSRSQWESKGFTGIEYPQAMPFSPSQGRGSSYSFNPEQELDMSKKDYGLQTVWGPDMTIADTNAWAKKQEVNPDLTPFDRNTYSDPMAKRQGLGRYYMNENETYAPSPGHFRGAR